MRAAVAHDGTQNLTGRDLARRAGVSNSSAIRVLPELEATGILEMRRVGAYGLYDLRTDQSAVSFIRHDARCHGYVVQVAFRRSEQGGAFVTLNGRGLEDPLGGMWVDGLVQRISEAFGESVDVAIEMRRPSALRGLMD